jgi:phage gp37-like protein
MASIIAAIEDAIQSHVKAALPGVLRETGTLPAAWTEEIARRVLQGAPSVWVGFLGIQKPKDCPASHVSLTWGVYAVSKEASEEARRRGRPNLIGAYEMVERLIPELDGADAAGHGSLDLTVCRPLFVEQLIDLGGTVYEIQFEARTRFSRQPTETLADFLQFHADYDFKPFDSAPYDAWLLEDHTEAPDAMDDVTISQE